MSISAVIDLGDLEGLWHDACAAYEKETGRRLETDNSLPDLRSLSDLDNAISSKAGKFHVFRKQHGKIWSTLKKVLGPVSAASTFCDGVASVSGHSGTLLIARGIFYLLQQCEEVSKAYDFIHELFQQLEEFASRLSQYILQPMCPSLKHKVISMLSFFLKLVGRSETLIKEGRLRKYLSVTLMHSDAKTRCLVDELNQKLQDESSFVLALTYSSVKHIEQQNSDLFSHVGRLSLQAANLQKSFTTKEDYETLRLMLDSAGAYKDMLETYHTITRNLVDGTGMWIEHENTVRNWLKHEYAILWLLGPPGSGKTYLATRLIQKLRQMFDANLTTGSDVFVAYFYIREDKHSLNDANTILQSLAYQLSQHDPRFRQHVLRASASIENTITAHNTWSNLFEAFYGQENISSSRAVLVLDGLDEAPLHTRVTLLELLRRASRDAFLTHDGRPRLQCAIIGRSELWSDAQPLTQHRILRLTVNTNREDLETYITRRLGDVKYLRCLARRPHGMTQANQLGSWMRHQILQGANGVFLWAKLIMDHIISKDLEQIQSVLTAPPDDLDEMIQKIFKRLSQDEDVNWKLFEQLLMMILYAVRPLCLKEILSMLDHLDQQFCIMMWQNLLGKFSSIFTLSFPLAHEPDNEQDFKLRDRKGDCDEYASEPYTSGLNFLTEDYDGDDIDGDRISNDDFSNPGSDSNSTNTSEADLFPAVQSPKTASATNSLHQFSDYQLCTKVTFCHSRIRDYLRKGNFVTRTGSLEFGTGLRETERHLQMFKLCIKILQADVIQGPVSPSLGYAAYAFVRHLNDITFTDLKEEEKQRILKDLLWIFREPSGSKSILRALSLENFHAYDQFLLTWFSTPVWTSCVRSWFAKAVHGSCLPWVDADEHVWATAASTSTKVLLESFEREASRLVLTSEGLLSIQYSDVHCKFLFRVLDLVRQMNDLEDSASLADRSWHHDLYSATGPPSDYRLIQLAESSSVLRTPSWYLGVAKVLQKDPHGTATSFFHRALESTDLIAEAHFGLAQCCWLPRDLERARKHSEAAMPGLIECRKAQLYCFLWWFDLLVEDSKDALETASKALEADENCLSAHAKLISHFCGTGKYDELSTALEKLDRRVDSDMSVSLLVRMLAEGHFRLINSKVFAALGKPPYLLRVLDDAIALHDFAPRSRQSLDLRIHTGHLRSQVYECDRTSIKYLEQAYHWSNEEFDKRKAGAIIGQSYFNASVNALMKGHSGDKTIRKLEKWSLVTSTADTARAVHIYGAYYPAILFGRWLRIFAHSEESLWKKAARPAILKMLDRLCTLDIGDQADTLFFLAKMLLQLGDISHGSPLLSITFSNARDSIKAVLRQRTRITPELVDASGEMSSKNSENIRGTDSALDMSSQQRVKPHFICNHPADSSDVPGQGSLTNSMTVIIEASLTTTSAETSMASQSPLSSVQSGATAPPSAKPQPDLKINIDGDSNSFSCRCDRSWMRQTPIWLCLVCNTQWACSGCCEKAESASWGEDFCQPAHDYFAVVAPSYDDEPWEEIVESVDDQHIVLKGGWIAKLRKEWEEAE